MSKRTRGADQRGRLLVGYLPHDIHVGEIKRRFVESGVDHTFTLTGYDALADKPRRVVCVQLPHGSRQACFPHPDMGKDAVVWGLLNRISVAIPPVPAAVYDALLLFVIQRVLRLIPRYDEVHDFDSWLAGSNYTSEQKEFYRQLHDKQPYPIRELGKSVCNSFVKDEKYLEWKAPRIINGRHKAVITEYSWMVLMLESVIYNLPEFVKHIPVTERARHVDESFPAGGHVFSSDFTSFECSITNSMLMLERLVALHVFDGSPYVRSVYEYWTIMTRRNKMCFRCGIVATKCGCRMSGDRTTSVGTCIIMLCIFKYLFESQGISYKLIIEGDDVVGWCSARPDIGPLTDLGFIIKMEYLNEVSEASFCGLVYDDKLHIVPNAIKVMLNGGWAKGKYAGANRKTLMSLHKAYALSVLAMYRGCPVVQHYAKWILKFTKMTRHNVVARELENIIRYKLMMSSTQIAKFVSTAHRDWPIVHPTPAGRAIMERLHNVPIDLQMMLEEYFNSDTSGRFPDHLLTWHYPRAAVDYYFHYDVESGSDPPAVESLRRLMLAYTDKR